MNNEYAIEANQAIHDAMKTGEYALLAPHLCHQSIRSLYIKLVEYVFNAAASHSSPPRALDLGAGDGTATVPFLERGAKVLAVDISEKQLEQLREKCEKYGALLETRKEEMSVVLSEGKKFDIIVMNSVLHHIPDYMGLLKLVSLSLSENGVFMSFQDPKWSPSISFKDAVLSNAAYFMWRVRRGEVLAGLWRRIRRMAGVYSDDSLYDNSEYHAVRDGVNQLEIRDQFVKAGLDCRIIEYCSFHSVLLQPIGERLKVRNTFAILTGRKLTPFLFD